MKRIAFCFSVVAAIVLRRNIPLFAIVAGFTVGRHVESMAGAVIDRMMQRLPAWLWGVLLLLFLLSSKTLCLLVSLLFYLSSLNISTDLLLLLLSLCLDSLLLLKCSHSCILLLKVLSQALV